ncbi:MAG TPA: DUF5063 domain-containing protein [Pyrinomonadaceae bacterium]|nr:DUF5063 domain-containing protein [Pyrinomonadaceae bacterium]
MSNSCPKEVDQFVVEARAFVSLCETSHDGESSDDFRNECLHRLAGVYHAALNIPDVPFREAPDPPPADDQKRLTENLMALPFQYYTEVLEPANLEKFGNVATGDLFDDFIDIHRDLSDGLWLIDHGHWEAAVFHWRQLHWHWSNHVIGALHALHLFEAENAIGRIQGQSD